MLFWTMLDIMKTVMTHNQNAYFLIENVKMKKDFEQYITHHTEQALGLVHKHLINSALVSAQNRNRYYWTNIEGVTQPEDKGLVLLDVLEDADMYKGGVIIRQRARGYNKGFEKLVEKAPTLSSSGWQDNHHIVIRTKSKCVRSSGVGSYDRHEWDSISDCHCRKFTLLECERLQTLPDNYTNHVSKTKRYKMIGNGWTVDVIAHILSFMKPVKRKAMTVKWNHRQLDLFANNYRYGVAA